MTTPTRTVRVCGDCLASPSHDQRSAARDGRCLPCITALARAAAKRIQNRKRIQTERAAAAIERHGQPTATTNDCLV